MLDDKTYLDSICSERRHVENPDRVINDYKPSRIVGAGTFGQVFLATRGGKSYAIKVLNKRKVIELNQVDHIK
jgi:serine/threonine protein kinase